MAPLRFRAWHVEQKKMYSPEEMGADELTLAVDGRGLVNVSGDSTRLSQYAGDRMIVMQSTGLKDKNGKEIFEGDIIRLRREGITKHWRQYVVDSLPEFFQSKGWDETEDCAYYTPKNLEVIGNIYENPELLPS